MTQERVIFKLQESPRQPWEMTQVHTAGTFDSIEEIEAVATWLMRDSGRKVRWNYLGSTQGHYIEVDQIGEARASYLRELSSQERDFQNSIGRYYDPDLEGPTAKTQDWIETD